MSFFKCINNKLFLDVKNIKTHTSNIKIEVDGLSIYEGALIDTLSVSDNGKNSGILKLYFNINDILYYVEKTNFKYSSYKLTNDRYLELIAEFNNSWEAKVQC